MMYAYYNLQEVLQSSIIILTGCQLRTWVILKLQFLTWIRNIPCWNEMNTSTLTADLQPFVTYFSNWFCGFAYNSPVPTDHKKLPTCIVQAWYNDDANRMDIDVSTPIIIPGLDSEKTCTWSLSFEPWSPVIKS